MTEPGSVLLVKVDIGPEVQLMTTTSRADWLASEESKA